MKRTLIACAGAICIGTAVAAAEGVDDAQIASIVLTANQVDIEAGRLAAGRASRAEVKAFAERMVTDHAGVNKAATELAGKLKLTPQDNPTSQSLKAGGEKHRAALGRLTGEAFDRAYIEHEVAYHQQVLDALDRTLVPNARNRELKALLVKTRPAFVAHLEHAKMLRGSLGAAH